MKAYGGVVVTSAQVGGEWTFTPRLLYPRRKSPGTHLIGGSTNPKTGLDVIEKNFARTWTPTPTPQCVFTIQTSNKPNRHIQNPQSSVHSHT
jgi:hypothetical protein